MTLFYKQIKSFYELYYLENKTFGSRLMERNPLQIVATMNVTKLNQMVGILSMFKMDIFFSLERWRSSPEPLLREAVI